MMISSSKTSVDLTRTNVDDRPPDLPERQTGEPGGSNKRNIFQILVSAPLLMEDKETPVEALSIQKEIDEIVQAIVEGTESIELEIIVDVATSENLIKVLTSKPKPLIIHYIGHGITNQEEIALLLEDKVGIARPFGANELTMLLEGVKEPLCQLAVLNACHSGGLAKALVDSGVSHVIGINAEDTVLDTGARCFAKTFYRLLLDEETTVLDNFLLARKGLLSDDELKQQFNLKTYEQGVNLEEYFKFNLLPANGDHNQPLTREDIGYGGVKAPKWEKTNLAQENDLFVGRKKYIHQIAVALEENKCVALHGMGGMGKTILAEAVGRWQHERKHYKDGVWLIELRSINKVSEARKILVNQLTDLSKQEKEEGEKSNKELAKVLSESQRLIILDDLDKLIESEQENLVELLEDLFHLSKVKILATARYDLPIDIVAQIIEVEGLKKEEAIATFKKYAPKGRTWWGRDREAQKDFEEIMDFLEGYPLPIRLAASYLKEQRCEIKRLKEKITKALEGTHRRKRNRDTSLKITLDVSYEVLPQQARDMFSRLASFPGGLSEELSEAVWGEDSVDDLVLLLQYSMAEKVENISDWRVRLPEPARQYAEKKQVENPIERYGNQVLNYFYQLVSKLDNEQKEELEVIRGKLKREQLNLQWFLTWGYDHETSQDKIARTSRITAILGKESPGILPGFDLSVSIEKALKKANQIRDILAEAKLYKLWGDIQQKANNVDDAHQKYIKALERYEAICGKLSEPLELAKIWLAIGELHQELQQWQKALKSYGEAQKRYQQLNDQQGIAKTEKRIKEVEWLQTLENVPLLEVTTPKVDQQGKTLQVEKSSVKYFVEKLSEDVELEMGVIPGGTFIMGTDESEIERLVKKFDWDGFRRERPIHEVSVSPFLMSKYPITQKQWRAIATLDKIDIDLKTDPSDRKGDERPVESVRWDECVEFCKRLSKLTGREYRLPSEAQWEYACRAGTTTPFYFGETITTDLANYSGDVFASEPKGQYREETTPVGQFPPNAFGLYDMHGNVWEWCADDWHSNYEGAPSDGSALLSNDENATKILRGGSWIGNPDECRSAFRSNGNPRNDSSNVGLRVVCCPPRT